MALLSLMMAGCRHEETAPPLPAQAQTPSVYIPAPPQPNLPPMEAPPPKSITEAKPTVTAEIKPKRKKKPVTTSTPATPVVAATAPAHLATDSAETPASNTTVAAVTPPPLPINAALGELSAGGGSDPQQQQHVADRIAAIERRLVELPPPSGDDQKKQIGQVKLFLKQASDALKTGDSEGAENLATKAGLLLDDIKK